MKGHRMDLWAAIISVREGRQEVEATRSYHETLFDLSVLKSWLFAAAIPVFWFDPLIYTDCNMVGVRRRDP